MLADKTTTAAHAFQGLKCRGGVAFAGSATQARTARAGATDASMAATDGSNSAIGASVVKMQAIGSLVQPKIIRLACEFSGVTVTFSAQLMAGVSGIDPSVPLMAMRTTSILAMASWDAVFSASARPRVEKALVVAVQHRLTLPSALKAGIITFGGATVIASNKTVMAPGENLARTGITASEGISSNLEAGGSVKSITITHLSATKEAPS